MEEIQSLGSFESGKGRTKVKAYILPLGGDFVVIIGGRGSHLGALGIGIPYKKTGHKQASLSLWTREKHQDHHLVKIAKDLSKAIQRCVIVIGGIHIPKAKKEEIEEILINLHEISETILVAMEKWIHSDLEKKKEN